MEDAGSKHASLASSVAATALLAASCSSTKQDGSSNDAASAYEERAPNKVAVGAPDDIASSSSIVSPSLLVDISPEIKNRCIPYVLPEEPFRIRPGSDLEAALGGLATCLSVGPLHRESVELVQPYGDDDYSDEAARRIGEAFRRLGIGEER